ISNNPLLLFISDSITQTFSSVIIEMTQDEFSRETVLGLIREHREILDAIRRGQGEEAFAKTRAHLLRTSDMYSEVIPLQDEVS
ncbi:MAG: FCD domain-containing protein, partial [Thermodesulfobacteriota bacterium]